MNKASSLLLFCCLSLPAFAQPYGAGGQRQPAPKPPEETMDPNLGPQTSQGSQPPAPRRRPEGGEAGSKAAGGDGEGGGGQGNAGGQLLGVAKWAEWNGKAAEKALTEAKRFRAETKNEDLKKLCNNAIEFEARAKKHYAELVARDDKAARVAAFFLFETFQARRAMLQVAMRGVNMADLDKGDGDSAAARRLQAQRVTVGESMARAAEALDELIEAQVMALPAK